MGGWHRAVVGLALVGGLVVLSACGSASHKLAAPPSTATTLPPAADTPTTAAPETTNPTIAPPLTTPAPTLPPITSPPITPPPLTDPPTTLPPVTAPPTTPTTSDAALVASIQNTYTSAASAYDQKMALYLSERNPTDTDF